MTQGGFENTQIVKKNTVLFNGQEKQTLKITVELKKSNKTI